MTRIPSPFLAVIMLLAVVLASPVALRRGAQDARTNSIEITGLKSKYPSCESVEFTIQKNSKTDIHITVYVENKVSGSWIDGSSYAINDPASLYSKTVRIDSIKSSKASTLSYDRCLRPTFVNEDDKAFRRRIGEEDKYAEHQGMPTTQRVRLELHEDGKSKISQKLYSQPFVRTADESLIER